MLLAERTFDINISSKFISSNYLRGKIDGLHNKKQQKDDFIRPIGDHPNLPPSVDKPVRWFYLCQRQMRSNKLTFVKADINCQHQYEMRLLVV